jgi:hypothetical protein
MDCKIIRIVRTPNSIERNQISVWLKEMNNRNFSVFPLDANVEIINPEKQN